MAYPELDHRPYLVAYLRKRGDLRWCAIDCAIWFYFGSFILVHVVHILHSDCLRCVNVNNGFGFFQMSMSKFKFVTPPFKIVVSGSYLEH